MFPSAQPQTAMQPPPASVITSESATVTTSQVEITGQGHTVTSPVDVDDVQIQDDLGNDSFCYAPWALSIAFALLKFFRFFFLMVISIPE